MLDDPIKVDGYDGSWSRWILFGGKRETLWTSYTAEPDTEESGFLRASLPSLMVQVTDFPNSFYSTPQGKKRIDSITTEISKLKDIVSENVIRVYGWQRGKSPRGWERLIFLVERVQDGVGLNSWLPRAGLGEEIAGVRGYNAAGS